MAPSNAANRDSLGPVGSQLDAPLTGVVVLEEGGGRSVRFAGRLLASYGATVIQVANGPEPPAEERDELPETFAASLDAGKLSVELDLSTEIGAQLLTRLEARSDVLIRFVEGEAASGPAAAETAEGAILVEISWFGRTGPWSTYLCDDFLAQHASGMAFTSALRLPDITKDGPRAVPGHLAEMVAGLTAATAAMVGLTGVHAGQPAERIDISVAESLVSFMRYETVIFSYGWGLPSRSKLARSPVAAPVFQQATADGYVDMLIMQEEPWRALLELLGDPAWGTEEIFATHPLRSQYWDALEPLLQEELAKVPTAKLYEEGQRRGIAIAPVNTIAQAANAPQFAQREFFAKIPFDGRELSAPGRPFGLGECPAAVPTPSRGGDTRRVFVDWLGFTQDELRSAGAPE